MLSQPTQPVSRQSDITQLPRSQAFVVQLSTDTDVGQLRYAGRIEHVMSGQTRRFGSWEELLSFISQVLDRVDEKPP